MVFCMRLLVLHPALHGSASGSCSVLGKNMAHHRLWVLALVSPHVPPHQPQVPLPAAEVPQQVGLHVAGQRLNVAQVLHLRIFFGKKRLKRVFLPNSVNSVNSTLLGVEQAWTSVLNITASLS